MPSLWLIDAFTERPFAGNPAGVCWLEGPVSDQWQQAVAMEMNQAETAFLFPEGDGFRLRWFTPAAEVDLCGHATLASAHYLWSSGRLDPAAQARFETRSGRLTARRLADGRIQLDFPATPPIPTTPPAGLLDSLRLTRALVLKNQTAQADYLVVLDDPAVLRALAPDFGAMNRIEARGVIVTAPGDRPGLDFISRFFGPRFGVPEDPVTGSAHCTLAPYWAERLGKKELRGFQASRRGGTVDVRWAGLRVELAGRAVTVLQGVIADPA